MRVISGRLGGRKLKGAVDKRSTRPVTDSVKEAIFNILGNVSGDRVLDLFAGTGSFGIEALSCGAKEVVFIDHDREAVKSIKENLFSLGLKASVHKEPVKKSLQKLEGKFDLIFVDPPFSGDLARETLEDLGQLNFLSRQGIVIVRCHLKKSLPGEVGGLRLGRKEKYGENVVYFYSEN